MSWKSVDLDVVLGDDGHPWIRKLPNELEIGVFQKPEFIKAMGYQWCPEKKWILMPWHAAIDISRGFHTLDLFPESDSSIKLYHLYQVFNQLALQLDVVHQMGYLHGDLHPQNLLLDLEKGAQVIDWGHCQKVEDFQLAQGTPRYYSPEHWTGRGVSPSSEVFSLGLIFWECLWMKHPFQGLSQDEIQVGADLAWKELIQQELYQQRPHMEKGLFQLLDSWLIERSIIDMDHLAEELEILCQDLIKVIAEQELQIGINQVRSQMMNSYVNEIIALIKKLEKENRIEAALEYANYGLTLDRFQTNFLEHVSRLSVLSLNSNTRWRMKNLLVPLLVLALLCAAVGYILLGSFLKPGTSMLELESQFTQIQSESFKDVQEVINDSLIRVDLPQGIQGEYLKLNQRYQNIQSGVLFLTPGTYQVEFSEDSYYLKGTLLVHSQGYQWDSLQ